MTTTAAAGGGGGVATTTCGAGGLLAFASTAFAVTYDPLLIPSRARMPPEILSGKVGGLELRIIRNRPSAITNVKTRN